VDRIQPIGPRPAEPAPIPAIRRSDRSTEKRERERPQQQRRRGAPEPEAAPPDDGRPHIDVRV
jgi:hypothetical protein